MRTRRSRSRATTVTWTETSYIAQSHWTFLPCSSRPLSLVNQNFDVCSGSISASNTSAAGRRMSIPLLATGTCVSPPLHRAWMGYTFTDLVRRANRGRRGWAGTHGPCHRADAAPLLARRQRRKASCSRGFSASSRPPRAPLPPILAGTLVGTAAAQLSEPSGQDPSSGTRGC